MSDNISRFKPLLKYLITVLIVLILVAIALYFAWQRRYGTFTNDAQAYADVIQLSSQVDGKVVNLYVKNHAYVKKGQPLFQIDKNKYELAVHLAQAQLKQAEKKVQQLVAMVNARNHALTHEQAMLTNLAEEYNEISKVQTEGYASKRRLQNVQADMHAAKAEVLQAKAQLASAQKALGFSDDRNASIKAAKAKLAIAELDLKRTLVSAPSDAYISNLRLYQGAYANAGKPVMTLINDKSWRVKAYFKETAIARMKVGDKAEIVFKLDPDTKVQGKIVSIGWGSSRRVSQGDRPLHYINPDEHWVKLPQRFSVRISFDETQLKKPLRVGATADVKIIR